ncbi:HSP20-like chaperone [Paraphysoderma sedebokerense]|nr:HSP20-like chaperone [Paraphysoderma sedebokerense]
MTSNLLHPLHLFSYLLHPSRLLPSHSNGQISHSSPFSLPLPFPSFPLQTPLDFIETQNNYIITIDLPGIKPNDISVTANKENDIVSVNAERKYEFESFKIGGKHHQLSTYNGEVITHLVERSYGHISRSVNIPKGTVDWSQAVECEFENGVVMIKLKKKPEYCNGGVYTEGESGNIKMKVPVKVKSKL